MSSEIKCAVEFNTRIEKATDAENSRYALSSVDVCPADEGTVYLTATNARVAAVVKAVGHTDHKRLIPAAVLPKKNPSRRTKNKVALNGRWETNDGRFAPDEEIGRFPQMQDVVPLVGGAQELMAMRVRVADLVALAGALNTDEPSLLIFFQPDEHRNVNGTLAVIGEHGFGVLSVYTPKESRNRATEFDAQAMAYKAALTAAKV